MEPEFIYAIIIALPVILFPAAYLWYLNIGGIADIIRGNRNKNKAKNTEEPLAVK